MPARRWRAGVGVGFLAFATASFAFAREVWVVQFNVGFHPDFPPCTDLVAWHSQLLFRNVSDQPLSVTFLGVSNGPPQKDVQALSTNPRKTVNLSPFDPLGPRWEPDVPPAGAIVWVNKLDVPDGIVVSDRAVAEVNESSNPGSPGPCEGNHYFSTGLPLRVFDRLTPATSPQYHLGIDIGNAIPSAAPSSVSGHDVGVDFGNSTQSASEFDSRINVGVFNASAVQATADVKVLCSPEGISPGSGEDVQIASTQMSVPPNSLVQQTVLRSTAVAPCPFSSVAP